MGTYQHFMVFSSFAFLRTKLDETPLLHRLSTDFGTGEERRMNERRCEALIGFLPKHRKTTQHSHNYKL